MTEKFFGNSLWHLVKQSDVVTKIDLLVLLFMSIFCWAIFFYKVIMFRIKRRQLDEAIDCLKRVTTLEGLIAAANRFADTLPGNLISQCLVDFKHAIQKPEASGAIILSEKAFERLQAAIDATVMDLVAMEESYAPALSISAAISPLLGLFGTIWGLVHSFVRIGELQTADIATVAPGIAEALITTLAGLMVAIPALAMYYYVVNKVRIVERLLFVCSDQISMILQGLCGKED
jgi:biopolymer transport protein TolQ